MADRLDREADRMQGWQPPEAVILRETRLEYLRRCQPKALREMRRAGTLEQDLDLRVKAAQSQADALIYSGEFPPQAWSRAIRSELLDSESD